MERVPIVAANWKMHKTISEAVAFIEAFQPKVSEVGEVEIVICPPATALSPLRELVEGGRVQLGAQNVHWEAKGAFTGELSPSMLGELCTFVIIGHSERRAMFGETDGTVSKKLSSSLSEGLRPILCVGESLQQREAGETGTFIAGQVNAALDGLSESEINRIVIAYEPIWAIGTGRAATPDDAAAVIDGTIRATLANSFSQSAAGEMRVLYGGSVKPENANSFFKLDGIDGALVGGASLDPDSFLAIVEAAV